MIALNGLGEDDNIRFHSIEGAQEPRDENNYFIQKNESWVAARVVISPVDPTSQLYTDIPSM